MHIHRADIDTHGAFSKHMQNKNEDFDLKPKYKNFKGQYLFEEQV
jgi:hypothetical protein